MRAFLVAAILSAASCSAAVQSGLPPLVAGCSVTTDCADAGAAFQCVSGACEIVACTCDANCPTGLTCNSSTAPAGQCLLDAGSTPCDAG